MQADTVMPTQSAPQASATPQPSYGAPVSQTAAQAPAVATSPQWVAPQQAAVAPAPQVQAQMGTVAPQYNPTQSVPQSSPSAPPAENPYKDAFNRVVGLLSSPVQIPFLGQQSPATQEYGQANYSSPQAPSYNNQGQQISQPLNGSNQAYYNNSSQTSQGISDQQLLENGVSPESLDVINHFGPDAPAVLNNYAVQIEDSLITTNDQLQEAVGLLKEIQAEHQSYEQILTDPDVLADYTCEFFGPQGPYPVEEEPVGQVVGNPGITPQQQAAAIQQQQAAAAQAQQQGQQFARPQMPVPPQPQAQENAGDFWNNFGALTDKDPANAWRYLNQAQQTPDIFRNKMLVME